MNAWHTFLASSLIVVGCTSAPPRAVITGDQERIAGALKPGTSAQEAREALVGLGYSCHDVPADAASSAWASGTSALMDCSKPIQEKSEFHVCLRRTETRLAEISYGIRPLCRGW